MNVQFHALLYVSGLSSRSESPNNRLLSSAEHRIAVYLKLASRLAGGIYRNFGSRLTLLTNQARHLQSVISGVCRSRPGFCSTVDVMEIPFPKTLPAGARFHSATNKIFVFDHFARRAGYQFLIDLDVICQRAFSDVVLRLVRADVPLVYDISDQVLPAFGYARIADDIRKFCDDVEEFSWYGGEFIGGSGEFYSQLFAVLQPMIGPYTRCWETLHHQGDEILVSSALNLLRQRHGPQYYRDVGALNAVRRHWGIPIAHDERDFRQAGEVSFCHLPAMKGLLATRLEDRTVLRVIRTLSHFPPLLTKAVGAGFSLLT